MNTNFEKKALYNQILFRYSKGKSHTSGNEIHPYHEILFYEDGNATFLSENYKEDLTRGSLLIIPKESYHKFRIKNQKEYTRFAINFPNFSEGANLIRPAMSQIKIIKNPGSNTKRILKRMCEVIGSQKTEETNLFLYGSFLSLLFEICNESGTPEKNNRHLLSKCLDFIDLNFTAPIKCDTIAKHLNVSMSTLFHLFKKEMDTSLNSYITQKRIIYAYKLLTLGESPTQIYWKCGYSDYSSFYKAFVKTLGAAPSKHKLKQ